MKTCSKCEEAKDFSEFSPRRASRDGLRAECKACTSAAIRRRYAEDGSFRQAYNQKKSTWERANPEKRQAATRRCYERAKAIPGYRRAADVMKKLRRTGHAPAWVKLADFLPIYAERNALGPGYVVDHTIPLNGESVSGLHVPENLQILTWEQNRTKSNGYQIAA